MQIQFLYYLNTETIKKNLVRYNLQTISKQALYDVLAVSEIIIYDTKSGTILFFQGELFGIINYLKGAIIGFRRGDKDRVGALSIEQLYSFEFKIIDEEFQIIDTNSDRIVCFNYNQLFKSFKIFYKKVLDDLLYHYPLLSENEYFQETLLKSDYW